MLSAMTLLIPIFRCCLNTIYPSPDGTLAGLNQSEKHEGHIIQHSLAIKTMTKSFTPSKLNAPPILPLSKSVHSSNFHHVHSHLNHKQPYRSLHQTSTNRPGHRYFHVFTSTSTLLPTPHFQNHCSPPPNNCRHAWWH